MIYFDSAATAPERPPEVGQAMLQALNGLGNPGRAAHERSLAAGRLVLNCRRQLADFFHVPGGAARCAFTSGATESLNALLHGLLAGARHAVTTAAEHNSVLRPLYRLQEGGLALDIVPCDSLGRVDPDRIESALRPDTAAIVCTAASNVTGNVTDLAAVGDIARRHGVLLIVDASQTAGRFALDMDAMGIDALAFSAHKCIGGPQGIGAALLREGLPVAPWKSGGTGFRTFDRRQPADMPTVLEAGTLNTPGIAGLSAALEVLVQKDPAVLLRREQALAARLIAGFREIPGLTLYGDLSDPYARAPLVSVNLTGVDSGRTADALWKGYGICVRPGFHCAPLMHLALGTGQQGTVRFSLCAANTEAEVDTAVEAMRELAK